MICRAFFVVSKNYGKNYIFSFAMRKVSKILCVCVCGKPKTMVRKFYGNKIVSLRIGSSWTSRPAQRKIAKDMKNYLQEKG